jgi:hypothetical protein
VCVCVDTSVYVGLQVAVQVAGPPIGVSCSASPLFGRALITTFTLNCTHWRPVDSCLYPLSYSFLAHKHTGQSVILAPALNVWYLKVIGNDPFRINEHCTMSHLLP